MNLVDRVAMGLGYNIRSKQQGEQSIPTFVSEIGAGAAWSGEFTNPAVYTNQARRYQQSWLAYCCINTIAQSGAAAELAVYQGQEDDPVKDHPFVHLINHPNPFTSRFELLESTLASMELTGNAFWFLHLDEGDAPAQIWLMRPDRIRPIPDKNKFIAGYKYMINQREEFYKPEQIVHFKRYHPLKDYEGLSPIEAANYALGTDVAAEKSSQAFYEHSMRVSAVLESDKDYVEPGQRREMEKYWLDKHTRPEHAYKPIFLWGGWKYTQMTMTPRDAEYVEGRKLNRTAISAIYGVHPGLLFSEDVNLANAQVAQQVFARITMAPKLDRIAQRINLEVMPLYDDDSHVKFINVVPKDRELEMAYHKTYTAEIPSLTINEVRRDLGVDAIEGGDVTLPQFMAQFAQPELPGGLSLPARSKIYALIGGDGEDRQAPYLISLPDKEVIEAERPEPFRWKDYP